ARRRVLDPQGHVALALDDREGAGRSGGGAGEDQTQRDPADGRRQGTGQRQPAARRGEEGGAGRTAVVREQRGDTGADRLALTGRLRLGLLDPGGGVLGAKPPQDLVVLVFALVAHPLSWRPSRGSAVLGASLDSCPGSASCFASSF